MSSFVFVVVTYVEFEKVNNRISSSEYLQCAQEQTTGIQADDSTAVHRWNEYGAIRIADSAIKTG